jgi:hypothetical protein
LIVHEKPAFRPYVKTLGKEIQLLNEKVGASKSKLKKTAIALLKEEIYQINLRLDMAFAKIKKRFPRIFDVMDSELSEFIYCKYMNSNDPIW